MTDSVLDTFAGEFYSGGLENIKRVTDMLTIGGGKRASFSDETAKRYQQEVDRIINSRLRPYYAVPLVKTFDGTWPEPIPYIASRLVASSIVLVEMTEIDANTSEAAEAFRNAGLDELDRLTAGLLAGTQRLLGQRLRTRMRFASPGIVPQADSNDLGNN